MKTIQFFLFFLVLFFDAFSQDTDPFSYHSSHQLSDTSYSIKKANGDSTIFLFEGMTTDAKPAITNLGKELPSGIFRVSFHVDSYASVRSIVIGIDYSNYCNVSAFHNAKVFTNLGTLDVEGTGLRIWSYKEGFPPTLNNSWLSANRLSSEELNKLLIYFNQQEFNPGPKNLYIHYQENNAAPTGDGLTAKASLEAKGWTVHM